MDIKYNMIIINDEIKIFDIFLCMYNDYIKKMDVKFKFSNNGKIYLYVCLKVEWLKNFRKLNFNMYYISKEG